ncbi:MAG: M23 family metallopeptidase [Nocardioides sp.]
MAVDLSLSAHLTRSWTARLPRCRGAALLSVMSVLLALVLHAAPAAAQQVPVPARPSPGPTQPAGVASPAPADGVWPLSPEPDVVSGFDPPASRWGAGHRGVDLAGSVGQVVHAAQAGTVSFAGRIAGRGVVVVDHGGTRTTYEPVAASVAVGDVLGAGNAIGRLELLGSHCLPRACLHWGLIRGTTYLDPLTLVGSGPVRLRPWVRRAGAPAGRPSAAGPW